MKKFLKKNFLIILALIYVLSPIDLIPDFLPAIGVSDDALVLLLTLFIKYLDYKKEKISDKKLKSLNNSDIKEGEIVE